MLRQTRIDRLARSIDDLQDIVRTVRARGASLKANRQPIDTSTAAGKCLPLGVFAEFEANLRRERQLESIAKAKAAGAYKGRPPSIDGIKGTRRRRKACGRSTSPDVERVEPGRVADEYATASESTMRTGRRPVAVVRVKINPAGRRALEGA